MTDEELAAKRKELAIKQNSDWIKRYSSGYMITIDTHVSEHKNGIPITEYTLRNHEAKIGRLARALNVFMYGRSYYRQENELHLMVSTEIGKESGMLHYHIAALSNHASGRDDEAVLLRLKNKICPALGFSNGKSAIDFRTFDFKKTDDYSAYVLKSMKYMERRFGDANILYV